MDEKKIEIEVLIEFNEYLKLAYFNIFRKLWLFWIVFIPLTLYNAYGSLNSTTYNFVISVLPIVVLFVFLIIFTYWSAKRNMKTSPVLSRASIYQFSDNIITARSEIFDSSLTWENIIKAQEKVGIIILYTTQNAGYFLPLRCFSNESQIIDFKELVRRKLGDKSKLKS